MYAGFMQLISECNSLRAGGWSATSHVCEGFGFPDLSIFSPPSILQNASRRKTNGEEQGLLKKGMELTRSAPNQNSKRKRQVKKSQKESHSHRARQHTVPCPSSDLSRTTAREKSRLESPGPTCVLRRQTATELPTRFPHTDHRHRSFCFCPRFHQSYYYRSRGREPRLQL